MIVAAPDNPNAFVAGTGYKFIRIFDRMAPATKAPQVQITSSKPVRWIAVDPNRPWALCSLDESPTVKVMMMCVFVVAGGHNSFV